MKPRSMWIVFLFIWTHSASAGFFDLAPQPLPYLAPEAKFTRQSIEHTLSDYKGKQIMLWMFSTWCHTCVAGVKEMQKRQADWKKAGLVILAIRNHNNGGYPGPDMQTFMEKFAPELLQEDNWITGEASAQMYQMFNEKKYPDIYFLIDEKGMVQTVSTAPNASMEKIQNFANRNKTSRDK